MDWFDTSLGRSLLELERRRVHAMMPPAYYPNALQLGQPTIDFLEAPPDGADGMEIARRYYAGAPAAERGAHRAVAIPVALPFAARTHNLIILPHTLDWCERPHEVLREVTQTLAPRGCAVITGFNPFSLWGAARLMHKATHRPARPPWDAHYRRLGRVQDWLSLLGFELVGAAMLGYQPPLQRAAWRRRLAFMERAGDRWWPGLAAVYVLIGRKKEVAMRPAAHRWRLLRGVVPPAAPQAATRAARTRQ